MASRQGATLGVRMQTSSTAGLEQRAKLSPADVTRAGPFFAEGITRPGDIDADGRQEILVPAANDPFAALVCTRMRAVQSGVGVCANNVVSSPTSAQCRTDGGFETNGNECAPCGEEFFVCPENPRTGEQPLYKPVASPVTRLSFEIDTRCSSSLLPGCRDGIPDTLLKPRRFAVPPNVGTEIDTTSVGVVSMNGSLNSGRDSSLYRMSALKFVEVTSATNANDWGIDAIEVPDTGIVLPRDGGVMDDAFGDGLVDAMYFGSCPFSNDRNCAIPRMENGICQCPETA
jgi:hypothetical protein